jgi:hypothetical protein
VAGITAILSWHAIRAGGADKNTWREMRMTTDLPLLVDILLCTVPHFHVHCSYSICIPV